MAFVLAVLKETQSGEQRSAVAPSTALHLQKIEADIRLAPIYGMPILNVDRAHQV